jgi:hypothetical protein
MTTTETGVYLQFFDEGESMDKELPPLGPFELLIIRHNRIIGDREQVEHDMMGLGAVERWLEAELELRRALGDEPGGVRRSHMRIRAPQGDIVVRFYDYGGDEAPKVPELGPFYALTIGKREVRADDKLLAIRATDMSPWTLTDAGRPGIAGINKADFSVFSLSVRDARPAAPAPVPPPSMREVAGPAPADAPPPFEMPRAGPQGEFVERRKVQREVYVARPDSQRERSLTPADVETVDKLKQQELAEQLMIERLRREQRVSPEAALHPQQTPADLPMRFQPPVREREVARAAAEAAQYEDEPFTTRLLRFLWSARLVLVTLLLVASIGSAYGYLQPKVAGSATTPPLSFAAMGDKVQSADWTYTVTSVERTLKLGTAPPTTGGYLIVHLTVSKKNADAPPLSTSDFLLVDANGARSLAFAPSSDLYTNTGVVWASKYGTNQFVQDHLVFDVNPNAKNLLLFIKDANVEVRLPDR